MKTCLQQFLREQDRVLICLPVLEKGNLERLMGQAVRSVGCVPVFPDGDLRWKNLLWLAFFNRAETVIATPHVVLGLQKVAKATGTPLFIHNVILCRASTDWQREGIHRGLDCRIWNVWDVEGLGLEAQQGKQAGEDPKIAVLDEQLLSWSSILDYRATTTEFGIDLEVITFPGEKIPKLPSCARLRLRNWDPENDIPFSLKI